VAVHVGRERDFVTGILERIEDMENGDLIPHDQAMDELDAIVAAARRRIA
jgi:hypothetical protein